MTQHINLPNCIVAQSGGPTVAINASLVGVICASIGHYGTVYGSINGILGILNQHYLNLTELAASGKDTLQRLATTPAMYLGSCRYKLKNYHEDASDYEKIFAQFKALNIKAFFYIGGNDSMDTVLKLSSYADSIGSNIQIIGIPKTIDNDLMITDHTPGFGSAAKYIASTLLEIAHDTIIYPVKSVTIIEIMGRDAGWLTAASALARNSYCSAPHLIYLPESDFNTESFVEDVRDLLTVQNNVIVAVSEGIHDSNGNYISSGENSSDTFGHSQLSGAGKALELLIRASLPVKVRSVEINILQRCAVHLSSATDLKEAFLSGEKAVSLALQGVTASMVIMKRTSDAPYTIAYDYAEIKNIANEAKSVPREWINARGNNVTYEMLTYLTPLIQGEVPIAYHNGLPNYMDVSHLSSQA